MSYVLPGVGEEVTGGTFSTGVGDAFHAPGKCLEGASLPVIRSQRNLPSPGLHCPLGLLCHLCRSKMGVSKPSSVQASEGRMAFGCSDRIPSGARGCQLDTEGYSPEFKLGSSNFAAGDFD